MKNTKIFTLTLLLLVVALATVVIFPNVAFAGNIWDDLQEASDQAVDIFGGNKTQRQPLEDVYLGGYPLGITLDGDGVTVVGLNEFVSEDGEIACPALEAGLQINDVVVELDGNKIYNSTALQQIATNSDGKVLDVKYIREGVLQNTIIYPEKDFATKSYRLGLWTKDGSNGVGTLTYVTKDLKFGCLGHPIVDNKGVTVNASNGGVYLCNVNGVLQGKRGQAGELRGSFNFENKLGGIYLNNKFGVFGTFDSLPNFEMQVIPVARASEVKPGKAHIYTTVDGCTRNLYEIEIVKVSRQSKADDKGMIIHICDKSLLEKTGGIVQGMSGSPIVQDGKLIGAVTHVFVNDPTRGYGIFAEWMLDN